MQIIGKWPHDPSTRKWLIHFHDTVLFELSGRTRLCVQRKTTHYNLLLRLDGPRGRRGFCWGNLFDATGSLTRSGSIKIVMTEMIEGTLSGLAHVPLFSGQRRSSCV